MKPERGFGLIIYLGLALAILLALGAMGRAIYGAGVNAEKAAQAERDRAAQAARRENDLQLREEGRDAAMRLIAAEMEARKYETQWNEARRALQDAALAVCPGTGPAVEGTAVAVRPGAGLRLTYGFLRLYDGAWTGDGGQPLFGDPGGAPEGTPAPDTPSARGLGEVLDVHAENARRASENSRQLRTLIEAVKRLRATWRSENQ